MFSPIKTAVTYIIVVLAITASACGANAQQTGKVPTIGYLHTDIAQSRATPSFFRGLRELGYVEGRNVTIVRRSAMGDNKRLREMAADLVRRKVDVIVGPGAVIFAAVAATRTIPIVVTVAGDYVAAGWAKSLRRPGGNVTGLSTLADDLMGKQLQLLKEVASGLSRVAIFHVPSVTGHAAQIRRAEAAAPLVGVAIIAIPVKGRDDLPAAFRRMKAEGIDGIVVLRSGFFIRLRGKITTYAREARLPSLFGHRVEAAAGGLMAYGADTKALFYSAASYVDRILKGADPAEMPISQATKFNLTVNLKTAKALGITVPPSILLRATEVIE
jgi:putative ABC transport system substrate-binding protein